MSTQTYEILAPQRRTTKTDPTGLGRRWFRWTVYRVNRYPQGVGYERVSEHWTFAGAVAAAWKYTELPS